MDINLLTQHARKIIAGMPEPVIANLELVDLQVYDTLEHANARLPEEFEDFEGPLPAGCKGAFIGEEMADVEEGEQATEDDLPDGIIALVAANIANEDDATVVLFHEVGHALGLDEEGLRDLGLGGPMPATTETAAPAAAPAAPPQGGAGAPTS